MLVHDFFTGRMPFLSPNSVRKHWRDGNIDKHHDTRGVFVEQRLDSGGLKDWPVTWTNWAKISDRVTDDLETAGCCPVSMAAVYTVSDSNCANVGSFVAVMVRDCIEWFRLPLPAVSEFYICRQGIVFVRWLTCVIFSPKYSHRRHRTVEYLFCHSCLLAMYPIMSVDCMRVVVSQQSI